MRIFNLRFKQVACFSSLAIFKAAHCVQFVSLCPSCENSERRKKVKSIRFDLEVSRYYASCFTVSNISLSSPSAASLRLSRRHVPTARSACVLLKHVSWKLLVVSIFSASQDLTIQLLLILICDPAFLGPNHPAHNIPILDGWLIHHVNLKYYKVVNEKGGEEM